MTRNVNDAARRRNSLKLGTRVPRKSDLRGYFDQWSSGARFSCRTFLRSSGQLLVAFSYIQHHALCLGVIDVLSKSAHFYSAPAPIFRIFPKSLSRHNYTPACTPLQDINGRIRIIDFPATSYFSPASCHFC
jgi:hypothetical protein